MQLKLKYSLPFVTVTLRAPAPSLTCTGYDLSSLMRRRNHAQHSNSAAPGVSGSIVNHETHERTRRTRKVFVPFALSCFRLPSTNSSGCAHSNAKPSAKWSIYSKRCCTGRFGGSCESRNSRKDTKDAKGFRAFRILSCHSCFRPASTTVKCPRI